MAELWHPDLPQSPLVDSFSVEPPDNLLQADPDRGAAQSYMVRTGDTSKSSWKFLMTAAQYKLWKRFFKEDLFWGAVRVIMPDDPSDPGNAVTMQIARGSVKYAVASPFLWFVSIGFIRVPMETAPEEEETPSDG